MSSSDPRDGRRLTSLGVFAIMVGGIIFISLSALTILSLKNWLQQYHRRRAALLPPQSLSSVSSLNCKEEKDLDLEAAVTPQCFVMNKSIKKPTFGKKSTAVDKKIKISGPTRLLPQGASHIVVRSPLRSGPHRAAQPHLPSTSVRSNRGFSFDSHRLRHKDPIVRGKSTVLSLGKTLGKESGEASAELHSFPKLSRQRTIVWFDDPPEQNSSGYSQKVRSVRSNSLPSTHSTWEAVTNPGSAGYASDSWDEEAIGLETVSQLWLSYQAQLNCNEDRDNKTIKDER